MKIVASKQKILTYGFTLLEMLLVVFIMGILMTTSLSFIENEDGQLRYQESIAKLDLIGKAVIDLSENDGQKTLSGFVFDNGVLPKRYPACDNDLYALTSRTNADGLPDCDSNSLTELLEKYGLLTPKYVVNSSDNFDMTEHQIFKGFRGPYLPVTGLDSDLEYKDGWGEDYSVDDNDSSLFRVSLKHEFSGGAQKLDGFDADVVREISQYDWSIDIDELVISVTNETSDSANDLDSGIFVALLIFTNDEVSDQRWKTYSFSLLPTNVTIAQGASHSFGPGETDIDWQNNDESLTPPPRIPVGRHLAVLYESNDGGIPPSENDIRGSKQFLLLPRSSIPTINLTYLDN